MGDPSNEYSLQLLGRFPGKDKAVAQALARAFGRDEAWGLQVVGASPITLMAGLSQAQSQAVYSNLMDVEAAGCRFQVQQGVDASSPQIGWPEPPRINGKLIGELVSGVAAGASTSGAPGQPTIVTVTLPCPYTGKPLILKIAVLAGEHVAMAPQGTIPIALPTPISGTMPAPVMPPRKTPSGGNAVPIPIPIPRPSGNIPTRPGTVVPIPVPIPVPGNPGHSRPSPVTRPSIPQPPPPRPRSVSPAGGSPALAPDEFEELVPIEPITASAPMVRPIPEPLPAPKPLPEVPMLEGQNRPVAAPMSGVDSRLSGPLDMGMFESALKSDGRPARASGIRAAVQVPAPKPSPEAGQPKAGPPGKGKGKH